MKTFEAECRFMVFGRVCIEAENEQEAMAKIKRGGGFIEPGNMDLDKSTAEFDALESIKEQ